MVAPVDSQRLMPEFDAFKDELRRKSAARSAGRTARKALPDVFGAFAEDRWDGRDAGAGSVRAGASADYGESGGVFTPDPEALARDLAVLDDLIATRAVSIEQFAAGNGAMESVVPQRDVPMDSPDAGPLPLDMAEFEPADRRWSWGRDGGSDAGSRRAAYIVVGIVGVGLASLVLMLGLGDDDGARHRTALAANPKTPSPKILRQAPPQETPDAATLATPDDASAERASQAAPAPAAADGKEIAGRAPAPQASPAAAEASKPGPKEAAPPPSPPAAKSVSTTPPAAKAVSSATPPAAAPAPRAQQAAAPAPSAQKPARNVATAKPVVQRERAPVARAAAPAAAAPAIVAEPAPPPPAAHVEAAPPEPASSSLLSLSAPLNLMKRATGAVTGSVSGVARRWGL